MRRLKKLYAIDLPIGINITCLLNKTEKIDTRLIGYEEDGFIILKFPYLTCIKKYLQENSLFSANFSCGSSNVFFTSCIESVVIKKFLAICEYPTHFKMFDMRAAQRVECMVPAGVSIDDVYYYGVLKDLSLGGCQLVLNTAHTGIPSLPQSGSSLFLELGPHNSTMLLNGEIKHLQKFQTRAVLGVAFQGMGGRETAQLRNYVQRLSDNHI